ncbi:MAG: galactose-1-phosphate uridylyltransferase [Candidatus Sericytochromatia bacterium]|nr:galactose-1-phosphate uridylyltransferase [Candidatus Sericytochromatia bacterium]
MHHLRLIKPDGRELSLYARHEMTMDMVAPSPSAEPMNGNPHMRWHPLRGEWVAYASHRQNRTFLPPPEYNPLAPTSDPAAPTEMPVGDYDVAVFENRFPTMTPLAHDAPELTVPTQPGTGACEVVVFSQDPHGTLGTLPVDHIALIIDVWADRTAQLGARSDIEYVMPFENRGTEVGVTLHHPHGQIYAFPFVPPLPARELSQQQAHWDAKGTGLLADHIAAERSQGVRMLYEGEHAVAFVPICARYIYEVWVAPIRPAASLCDLTEAERLDLARALKTVLLKYDGLWNRPFPYLMILHQAPTDGQAHPEAHVHLQFYSAFRSEGRLKYLAGCEMGAGTFTNDSIPEEKAAELQAVAVTLD